MKTRLGGEATRPKLVLATGGNSFQWLLCCHQRQSKNAKKSQENPSSRQSSMSQSDEAIRISIPDKASGLGLTASLVPIGQQTSSFLSAGHHQEHDAQLTPPYSPGKFSSRHDGGERLHYYQQKTPSPNFLLSLSFPSPASPTLPHKNKQEHQNTSSSGATFGQENGLLKAQFPFPPACCRRHDLACSTSGSSSSWDSSRSVIGEKCVGALTENAGRTIPDWAVGMTGRELEIRLDLMEIQKLYKSTQLELKRMDRQFRLAAKKKRLALLSRRRTRSLAEKKAHKEEDEGQQRENDVCSQSEQSQSQADVMDIGPLLVEVNLEEEEEAKECENDLVLPQQPEEKECCQLSPALSLSLSAAATCLTVEEEEEEETISNHTKCEALSAGQTDTILPSDSGGDEAVLPANGACCPRLTADDLTAGQRVILLEGGLFYPGTLQTLDLEALIYSVSIDGQRATRPYILCQEELIDTAMKEVRPKRSKGAKFWLRRGQRVCAYWSGRLPALYPGTVTANLPIFKNAQKKQLVPISFDDGDCGEIGLEDIRLLPRDFPITKVSTPVLPEFITRRRRSAGAERIAVSACGVGRRASVAERKCSSALPATTISSKWEWGGRSGSFDRKRKRVKFDLLKKGPVEIKVGDLVYMLDATGGSSKSSLPYVAVVDELWQTHKGCKKVRVSWCYRWQETTVPELHQWKVATRLKSRALFTSTHCDDNDVESISAPCRLLTYSEFVAQQRQQDDCFFFAGTYDPVSANVHWQADFAAAASSSSSPSPFINSTQI